MKYAILIAFIAIFSLSCGKSSDPVPNVGVDFEAPLTDPRLAKLNVSGGSVIVNGYGVAGLIIYHEIDGSYAAYDRCSSYKPENRCAVTIDTSGFTVTDPCSGSKFSLIDGTPVKGPATTALKSYYVTVANYEIFVSN
jgi:nitrite reductase/ring-hydroxylating ferredoxin subunit